ncbi:vicilin-like seed storage protein At2g28490 [Mercurialis annua]|uniref:vicilin-like seed storage protein At2g28490 n=1 Tax=Mercurialis annua TaxID=3986 RepID=UPI00215F0708|nr:vicilin-like seed storage protein At2g28490 [Mercurialis annua]
MIMGKNRVTAAVLVFLAVVLCYGSVTAMSKGLHREDPAAEEGKKGGEDWFLLQDSKRVVKTDAGDVRVVKNFGGRLLEREMHIGFITMEPKSLFVPQYLDSNLIIFIQTGEAKIGMIYRSELAERTLKMGDIYRIPAGSAFYLVNTGEGQRLHVICSIDPSEGLGWGTLQSFFIGGGTYPTSILSGFEPKTLATAFNATIEEVEELMSSQRAGPIIYLEDSRAPSIWTKYFQMKEKDRLKHMKRMMGESIEVEEESISPWWSWRKLLDPLFGQDDNEKKRRQTKGKSPDSYNIYKRKADFKNNYGSSIALDDTDYDPLKNSGIGVYYVNLTAGSMMAPHLNPTATEYGVVLSGTGVIQIVYPNGTQAMKAKVAVGDVFWIPRYFPFCQIASRTGPFEFFGFTTSARKNRPQFLAGSNSILNSLRGPELAASFGMPEDRLWNLIKAQREAVILPSASASPPDEMEKEVPRMKINSFGKAVMLDLD